ncbi:Luciferase [Operophtera brumata]|uniref:Luciferase n=1 Tax=Operophtera brumata TaxID=104452 RepID=A0A0L7LGB7_OPEBR|nr:Luciferase [Operophtera brumata]
MHPGVREASVVGQPDQVYGELPTAFIVPPYMQLKGGVKFIEELPKNPRGKILRQPLKDMLKEL